MADEEVVDLLVPAPPLSDGEFEQRKAAFDAIFADCPAQDVKQKSLAERKEKEVEGVKSLTYSELDISTVNSILNLVKDKYGPIYPGKGCFLDVGSGAGKACIAAGLLHPFEKVVGVELLQCLNDLAGAANGKYQEAQVPEGVIKAPLEFVKGDFVMEFEAVMEPLAPTTQVALCVATCFGEEQLGAIAKFADKMPEGSIFVTFSQELPESLLIDINRNPKLRRAAATKKALAARGKEPDGAEIVLERAPNNPQGWKRMHREEMEMMWGMATCYIFKKYETPFCNAGELCLAAMPQAEEDPTPPTMHLAKYVDKNKAIFFDDTAERTCEVGKMAPFTAEDYGMVMEQYSSALEANKKAEQADAKTLIAATMEHVQQKTGGKLAGGDKIQYAHEEGSPFPADSEYAVQGLLKDFTPIGTMERAVRSMLPKWEEACMQVDKDDVGALTEEQVLQVWTMIRGEFAAMIEGKISELQEWQKSQPPAE